jgi:hypothetical protein
MANWKKLTSETGEPIWVNLDLIIQVVRHAPGNFTALRSGAIPNYTITVREAPDEIFSASAT